jgi:hypothetical protein
MSIKLKFDADSSFVTSAMHTRKGINTYAIEACAQFLLNLKDNTLRLEKKIFAFTQNQFIDEKPTDSSRTLSIDELRLIIGDVWQIIFISSQIIKLYPLLGWNETALSKRAIELRDSLTNLPFLIQGYFPNEGDRLSVLGDLQWGYRDKIESNVKQCYLNSGSIRPGNTVSPRLNSNSLFSKGQIHRFDGHSGIFGVEFYYVTRNDAVLDILGFMIDDLIEEFNQNIESTERTLIKLQNQVLRSDAEENITTGNAGPFVIVAE